MNTDKMVCSIVLSLLTIIGDVHAEEWVVSQQGNGQFTQIQSAVNIASDGDQITVLQGNYVGSNGDYVVDVYNKTLFIVAPQGPEVTKIYGMHTKGGIRWDGSSSTQGEISGFHFIACNTNENGGGLKLTNTGLAVHTCIFELCEAEFGGGAYVEQFTGSFSDCQFSGNMATDKAGALYAKDSAYALENVQFTSNTAAIRAGAIRNWESTSQVSNCTFNNNNGGTRGGAIHSQSNSAGEFVNCNFTANQVTSLGGAVVDNSSSDSIYTNCNFEENESTGASGGQGRGGAAYSDGSFVQFVNCTFESNTSSSVGGAIYNWASAGVCWECDIKRNTALNGGAIYTASNSYSQEIAHTTICGNSAEQIVGNWSDVGDVTISDCCDDIDSDQDGTPDCSDLCPNDPDKIDPGICGCDVADTDSDGDGVLDCNDPCPQWPFDCSDAPTSIVNPGESIQDAVDNDVDGGVIWIRAGTYNESVRVVDKSITLLGEMGADGLPATIIDRQSAFGSWGVKVGYGSCETVLRSLVIQNCTLGGVEMGVQNASCGSHQIIDCVIRNNSNSAFGEAGGITLHGSNATIQGCLIEGNSTETGHSEEGFGGGIRFTNGTWSPSIIDCVIRNNTSERKGAGLAISSGTSGTNNTLTISGCTFEGNEITGAGWGEWAKGAGLYLDYLPTLSVDIQDSDFTGNTAHQWSGFEYAGTGAGAYLMHISQFNAENCTFQSNTGGGLYLGNAYAPTLTNCDFLGNSSTLNHAGAIINTTSSEQISLTGCRFENNVPNLHPNTTQGGGGASITGSNVALNNCTASNNHRLDFATGGAGLSIRSQFTIIEYTDIASNVLETIAPFPCQTATLGSGGGLSWHGWPCSGDDTATPTITISNTVINNNHAPLGGGAYFNIGDVLLSNTTIYENKAQLACANASDASGGGVYFSGGCLDSSASVIDCDFWSNEAGARGAGIYLEKDDSAFPVIEATLHVEGTTFTGNVANTEAGLDSDPAWPNNCGGAIHSDSEDEATLISNTFDCENYPNAYIGNWDATESHSNCLDSCDDDEDGTFNCYDLCPNDPNKIDPGVCGCGKPEDDTDGDGTADCADNCPDDPDKTEPGNCGCGVPETDVFGDLDCDGDYDIDDARLAMTTFGIEEAEEDTCPADVDGDGSIGFSDVLSILNDWGACP